MAIINGDIFEKYEKGDPEEVVIPEGIKTIAEDAFKNAFDVKSVQIPDSVTEIGRGAFYSCISLRHICIPEGITTLPDDAFRRCGLISAQLPSTLKNINAYAFGECDNLTDISIPDGVERIEGRAFLGCKKLVNLPLPGSVKHIGASAFAKCALLEELNVPEHTEISPTAFEGCRKLADSQGLIIINGTLFEYFGDDKELVLPDQISVVGTNAFAENEILQSLTLMKNLTELIIDDFEIKNITVYDGCKIYITHLPPVGGSIIKKISSKTGEVVDKCFFGYAMEDMAYNWEANYVRRINRVAWLREYLGQDDKCEFTPAMRDVFYDRISSKEVRAWISLFRLTYPDDLSEDRKAAYHESLKMRALYLAREIIDRKDSETLAELASQDVFSESETLEILEYANYNGNGSIRAVLMDYKNKKFAGRKGGVSRLSLD